MAAYDFTAPRLHVEEPLGPGARIVLDRAKAHYLLSVLRLPAGASVLLFNGRDGEWRAALAPDGRRAASLEVGTLVRAQTPPGALLFLFAPLKHARLDYGVQKAVEMGCGALRPVITRRTVPTRVNRDRMRANAIEAAEQCGILSVPAIHPETDLRTAIADLPPERLLAFCDEEAPVASPLAALSACGREAVGPVLLIGPEGGFDDEERALILAHPRVCRLSLGPRILRADTAAVAAQALLQAVLGDWR